MNHERKKQLMIDLILSFLLMLLIAAGAEHTADEPAPAPAPVVVPCSTDADCAERNPHVPEPGHEEPHVCDEPICDELEDHEWCDGIVVEDGSCVPPSFFDDVPVPSVSEGLGSLGYLPCEQEDGPGPCYWDAAVRGNGEGDSYVIDSLGGVIPLAGD